VPLFALLVPLLLGRYSRPGKPARYVFRANIEGIFEVELEEAGVQLIKLQVDP
jgi:hypothetical protein